MPGKVNSRQQPAIAQSHITYLRKKNEQNQVVILFKFRKGLVKQFLLPYLEVKEKMTVLPSSCVLIRHVMTSPKENHHFFIII